MKYERSANLIASADFNLLTKPLLTFTDSDWANLAAEFARSSRAINAKEKGGAYKVKENITPSTEFYRSLPPGVPRLLPSLQLRDYQREAAVRWIEHRGRGTLKMATGSGKTIVALAIAAELYAKIGLQVLLVICPYRHLVAQWGRECEQFNLQPLLAFESVRTWHEQLTNQLYNLRAGTQPFLTIIATNSTFVSENFQSQLQFLPEKTLIVGDEAHNLGSVQLEASLPRSIGLRLALSATPERYFDEGGTDLLLDYFGAILQPEFTLKDAIAQGALARYNYYPLFVELTPAEAWSYAKLTKRIGWALSENEGWETNPTVTALLMQRSRLVGSAANKLNALRELMLPRLNTTHTLFYCGDGSVDVTRESETGFASVPSSKRQLAAVARLLGSELGYRINTYTAETPLAEREAMRAQFERGELQGLVAIRCLDEGVDIPAIQNAVILASTGNPRQFIQRRGRILRPYPGKERANLFDTIVLPPECDRETWEVERNLLRKELKRFLEFAELAENAGEAKQKLFTIQERFGLE
ncbi:DNA phosphorothioation system restriction enzyme [Oscillatoria sp. FACHB-1406]|uniref:DNA phosphorothioation system restriction enzyme n=1 Tax=Oscillatoria sp. FACHB-1406 TaxID=2692846 RepID=UPI0016885F40|nr:DNA phosphorothioation system restriction enzyme [Oscillatoria sp. FACHB-1406]MBD2578329.1 DNA phosphorothioation system restriction enzyme [Oscillatoria sp. FACHB-1406]